MTLSPENKKYAWSAGILVVIVLLIVGANEWNANAEANAHPCAINFLATFLYNVSSTTPKEAVAKTLLTQYLTAYEHVPHCPADGIKDYAITSVGTPTNVRGDFTVPIVFDLLPLSKTLTVWATGTSTHWDGDWIRGHQATLGIQHIQLTPGAATSTYRLVI